MSEGSVSFIERWRAHLNPEASDERMAITLSLVVGGAVLSMFGVLLVALGDTVLTRPSWLRELGFAATASGLPVFLVGVGFALPSRWWQRSLVGVGLLFSAIAVGLFAWLYPDQWHLTVQTPNGYAIGSYLIGVTFIAAGTAGAVGAYLIERMQLSDPEAQAEAREISEEEIEADLEWAARQGWSWGGVRPGRPDVNLVLSEEHETIEFLGQADPVITDKEFTDQDVLAAKALTSLRGRSASKRNATDSGVEDQVDFLKQLKQQKASAEAAERDSLWWKVKHPIQAIKGE